MKDRTELVDPKAIPSAEGSRGRQPGGSLVGDVVEGGEGLGGDTVDPSERVTVPRRGADLVSTPAAGL